MCKYFISIFSAWTKTLFLWNSVNIARCKYVHILYAIMATITMRESQSVAQIQRWSVTMKWKLLVTADHTPSGFQLSWGCHRDPHFAGIYFSPALSTLCSVRKWNELEFRIQWLSQHNVTTPFQFPMICRCYNYHISYVT